ncbi:hypothetical protein AX17_002913 [Amanita inopinata Kibby_2008]|nr:hypothetical protein AX17_002913 [Amanita inopinata Kibby_2008]
MSTAESGLSKLFTDTQGRPIRFHIHKSIKDTSARNQLIRDIKKHGGKVLTTDVRVDTVLVQPGINIRGLQDSYDVHPNRDCRHTTVEETSFVHVCIDRGVFRHGRTIRKAMGGSAKSRRAFTESDEENLCRFMAIKIPERDAGGRLGTKIYERLMALPLVMPEDGRYEWVNRHTQQSWREHYKKNRDRMDAMIEYIADLERPTSRQLFEHDRRLAKGEIEDPDSGDSSHRSLFGASPEEEEESEDEVQNDLVKEIPNTGDAAISTQLELTDTEIPPIVIENTQATLVSRTPATVRKPRKRKQARGTPAAGDAPYRNTRARSRSHDIPGGLEQSTEQGGGPISAPETLMEEADVEQLLATEDHEPNVAGNTYQQRSKRQGLTQKLRSSMTQARDVSNSVSRRTAAHHRLETDDEQIDRLVHESILNSSKQSQPAIDDSTAVNATFADDGPTSTPLATDPLALLKEFNDSSLDIQSTPRPASLPGAWPARPFLLPSAEADGDPWASPEPSEESFPLRGTRASNVKKQVEEEKKKGEYVPPLNTRAARYRRKARN